MILLAIPLIYGIDMCERETIPRKIPCLIVGTFQYKNNCDTYDAKIYNASGNLLSTKTLGNIGIYCNFTFNYTDTGTYYYNISSGETGVISIGEDDKMYIALAIVFSVFAVLFFLLGLFLYLHFKEKE